MRCSVLSSACLTCRPIIIVAMSVSNRIFWDSILLPTFCCLRNFLNATLKQFFQNYSILQYQCIICLRGVIPRPWQSGHPHTFPLLRDPARQSPPKQRPPLDRDPLDTDAPGQRPPWTQTPWTETSLGRDLPGQRPPGHKRPWTETPSDKDPPPPGRLRSRRYAFYWNAYLFTFGSKHH